MDLCFPLWISLVNTEAATEGVLWEKVFLETSQNSQENTCAGASFLIKEDQMFWNALISVYPKFLKWVKQDFYLNNVMFGHNNIWTNKTTKKSLN